MKDDEALSEGETVRVYVYRDTGIYSFYSTTDGEAPMDGFGDIPDVTEVPKALWDAYAEADAAKTSAAHAIRDFIGSED